MPELTTPLVSTSQRPRLIVAGAADEPVSERIVDMAVRQRLNAPARLTLDFSPPVSPAPDQRNPVELAARLAPGTPVAVHIDDPAATLFSGRVTAIEHRWRTHGPYVRITAHDGLDEWAYAERTRRFEDSAMADVAAVLADGHGVSVQVAAADSGLTRSWIQFSQTDAAFLAQVCATVGADFFLEDDELFVQTPARAADSAVSLQYGQGLVSFSAEVNLGGQVTSVSVHGWDPATKQAIGRSAAFPDAELRQCESGPRTLHDQYVQAAPRRLRQAADSHVHADAMARAAYEDRAQRFVTARGAADSHAELLVGEWVAISGLDARHDGRYYLREVRHRFTVRGGFKTAFVAQRPCRGQPEDSSNDSDDQGDPCGGPDGGKPGRRRHFDPLARVGKLARRRRRPKG